MPRCILCDGAVDREEIADDYGTLIFMIFRILIINCSSLLEIKNSFYTVKCGNIFSGVAAFL
jgi:hypothetical protein